MMEASPHGWESQPDGQSLLTECNTQYDFFNTVEAWLLSSTFPPKESAQWFMPATYTQMLSQKFMIDRFIKDDDLANKVFRDARKLFVITAYMVDTQGEIEPVLKTVIEDGINDNKLPISHTEIREISLRIFSEMPNFHQKFVKQFCQTQNRFCLPHFEELRHKNYSKTEWGMPLYVLESIGNGAFGRVYKVKIHPDHDGVGKVRHKCPFSKL